MRRDFPWHVLNYGYGLRLTFINGENIVKFSETIFFFYEYYLLYYFYFFGQKDIYFTIIFV